MDEDLLQVLLSPPVKAAFLFVPVKRPILLKAQTRRILV